MYSNLTDNMAARGQRPPPPVLSNCIGLDSSSDCLYFLDSFGSPTPGVLREVPWHLPHPLPDLQARVVATMLHRAAFHLKLPESTDQSIRA